MTESPRYGRGGTEASPRLRARRAPGSAGLAGWRRARPSMEPEPMSSATLPAGGRPRRTRTTLRPLLPPPRFQPPEIGASVTAFLASSAVPKSCAPESTDQAFKAHAALLRKVTLDSFDLNRYLFVYKPLAKVNAVLTMYLLNVVDIEARGTPMSPVLRSAAMYVSANAHRSVYAMVMSSELKSAFKPRPAAENIIPDVVLRGETLTEHEMAALDFVQELSSENAQVSEDTRRRVIDGSAESDGQLERLVAGVAAFTSFLSRLTGVVDFELTYEAVQYATANLQGLPWKPSGGHFLIESLEDELDDAVGVDCVGSAARQRLTKGRRSARNVRDRSGTGRDRRSKGSSNMRRMSHFLTNSITAPRMMADATRATESWMRTALLPLQGQIFEMNDAIAGYWGFEPFYLSTAAVAGEPMRRAFVLGARELLFQEKDVSKRTKFIICYVLSSGMERLRREKELSEQKGEQDVTSANRLSTTTAPSAAPERSSTGSRDYDALSVMSAHAAFLACRYGATPAELNAAIDLPRVQAAMSRYMKEKDENSTLYPVGFPLTKRDCAAILLGHAMISYPPRVDAEILSTFEAAFGSPLKQTVRGGRLCHRAFLEIVGAAAMWGALERFAVASLAFDIDLTSNIVFGAGRAEPVIMEFAQSAMGTEIGLSLYTEEVQEVKARRESKVARMSSLRSGASGKSKRAYRKRSSSALTTGPARVVRMLSNIGPNGSNHSSMS